MPHSSSRFQNSLSRRVSLAGVLASLCSLLLLAVGTARAQAPEHTRAQIREQARAEAHEQTREQALRTLVSADAQKRRDAVDRLGEIGRMADSAAVVAALRDSDPDTREHAELALWRIWSRSGDKEVDRLFAEGMERMGAGDLDEALVRFNRVVRLRPDFAEGWNKRATLYFMAGEWTKALTDCEQVIRRNPNHFGALAGYSLIYLQLERYERAREFARRALDVNPNMEGVRQNLEMIEQVLREKREKTT